MARIDDYFFELEDRINRTKNKDEMKILVEEARKLYFPSENRNDELKYKGEFQRYFIDKDLLLADLKDVGMSYRKVAKSIGLKNVSIRKFKDEYFVALLDKDRKNILELTGLDISSYTTRTETSVKQPLRPIKSNLIREALEDEGLKVYKVSVNLVSNGGLLTKYLREDRMPLHIAMELCDMLDLEHEEVIIKEDN